MLSSSLSALRDLAHVADVRQCGLMAGIELAEDVSERRPFPAARRVGKRVTLEARQRGVILRPLGDVIVLMPPLSTSEEELRGLVEVAAQSIQTAVKDS